MDPLSNDQEILPQFRNEPPTEISVDRKPDEHEEARQRCIHAYEQKSIAQPDELLACLGLVNSGLVDLALRYRNVIVQSFTDESSNLEHVRKVAAATDDYLRLVRQVQAYAQLEVRFREASKRKEDK